MISISQKQEVLKYQSDNPKASQQSVGNHFSVVWRCEVKRRTVGDMLQNRDKWLAQDCEPGAKKLKTAKHSDLEETLFLWFSNVCDKNGIITDDILREKAKELGEEFNINDFTYSNGWLYRFKKRHGIASHTLCGESAGVDKTVDQWWSRKSCDCYARLFSQRHLQHERNWIILPPATWQVSLYFWPHKGNEEIQRKTICRADLQCWWIG